MGDAVLRAQRHLRDIARNDFTGLETAHGRNADWLRHELGAVCRDINVAVALDLKRPVPATFTCAYVFVAKKRRLSSPQHLPEPTTTTTHSTAATTAPRPRTNASPPPRNVTSAATSKVPEAATAAETAAVTTQLPVTTAHTAAPQPVPVKRTRTVVITRTRRVLRPKASKAAHAPRHKQQQQQQLEPERMKVVELRAELKRRGLKFAGLKAVLARRLRAALDADDDDDASVDSDAVVEMEEVDEPYDVEIDAFDDDPATHTTDRIDSKVVTVEAVTPVALLQRSSHDDSIVRESFEDLHLSQKSQHDDTNEANGNTTIANTNDDVQQQQQQQLMAEEDGDASPLPLAARVKAAKQATAAATVKKTRTVVDALMLRETTKGADEDALSVVPATTNTTTATAAATKASFATRFASEVQDRSMEASRTASLPLAPVTPPTAATNTSAVLPIARSEPLPTTLAHESDSQRQARENSVAVALEAQRLRLNAKMSAKKRFEEAKLRSSLWSNARASSHSVAAAAAVGAAAVLPPLQQRPNDGNDDTMNAPQTAARHKSAIKTEPSTIAAAATIDARVEAPTAVVAVEPLVPAAAPPVEAQKATQASVKPEPRKKPIPVPFATSTRRFSDDNRRTSATSSTTSRRTSAARRRDSGSSTVSSVPDESSTSSSTSSSATNSTRALPNVVSGIYSLTSLLDRDASSQSSLNGRSGGGGAPPVVAALKVAEKTRLLEQRKQMEKAKRKEALLKKYEEQRRVDDERKRKLAAIASAKDKSERDAKLKREAEKKQLEAELAKRRQQKLQEMRAGLEKKRAQLAAEKQAKLAAHAQRRTSNEPMKAPSVRSAPVATATSTASTAAPLATKASVSTNSNTQAPVVLPAVPNRPVKPARPTPAASAPVIKPNKPAQTAAPVVKPNKPVPTAAAPTKSESSALQLKPKAKPTERPTDTSTYDMSDNAESSSEEDGNSDDDAAQHNKKNIPRWARKENLERALRVQFGPNAADPSPSIFPDFVDTCDLDAIFQPTDVRKIRRFAKRTSSGNWFGDRPTAREKALYKRDMGYDR